MMHRNVDSRAHSVLAVFYIVTATVFILVVGSTFSSEVYSQGRILYVEDFEGGDHGWQLNNGWEIIPLESNHVLSGQGHTWAVPPEHLQFAQAFRLEFQLMLLSGRIHLNYNVNDTGRYFIGFEEAASDITKQIWDDTFIPGTQSPANFPPNQWHHVSIEGIGNTITLFVNGTRQWRYEDPTPLGLPASFAFETLDGAHFYIDEIVVFAATAEETPPTAPTQPAHAAQAGWIRTGGPIGGLGYDIRMHPENPDRLYVTDAWAGVHISTDAGLTWQPANTGIVVRIGMSGDAIPIFCLTIDPNNPDVIWSGTDAIRGIYKSTDGGVTWRPMHNGVVESAGITFRGFAVDPRDSDTVYAAAEIASWVWAGQDMPGREFDRTAGVVYRTTNGGESWTAIWRGENLARYVIIDPRDSNMLYLSTGIFDREAANSDPAAGIPGGEGVLKSVDGGDTWFAINNGLKNLYIGSLDMHPTNPDILLAGAHNNQYFEDNGVYLTTDAGQSWTHVLDLPEHGGEVESVAFAPADPRIAYAGGSGSIFRSEDGGRNWTRVSGEDDVGWGPPGVRGGFPIDIEVDPRDPYRLFANNYGGGNFLSEDGGETWTVASAGYTGAQVRGIAVDPSDPNRVFAAARSGAFMSADAGATWVGLNHYPASAIEWYAVAIDPTQPQHVLAANNQQGSILESHNRGVTWTHVSEPVGGGLAIRTFAFAPSNPATVYAGLSAFHSAGTLTNDLPAGGIWVSRDGGTTWQAANNDISQDANVIDLAVAVDNPNIVYAATGNHDLIKSVDGGQTWQALQLGLAVSHPALAVAVHPDETDTVFVGLEHAGVLHSENGGQSWRFSGIGLNPEAVVSDIVFDPTNPTTMYLSDRLSGVYRSTDGGASWHALNTGLRMRDVNALSLSADGQYLYAATEGEGVYRLATANGTQ